MIKTFLAAAMVFCSASPFGEYPKNVEKPNLHLQENGEGIKYWILLEPKCVIETVYTKDGAIGTEITILDPGNTDQKSIISLVEDLEGIEPSKNPMTFAGMNREETEMYTLTESDHLILWKRDSETEKIEKVIIVYHRQKQLDF